MDETWYVYVIHFLTPVKHAGHYTGIATDPYRRFEEHKKGKAKAGRLCQVAVERGVEMVMRVVSEHDGYSLAHTEERRLKSWGGAKRFCPVCKEV